LLSTTSAFSPRLHLDDDAHAVLVGLVAQTVSAMPSIFFSLTSSAIFSISRALFTW
jgi:hypothetical protein